MLRGRPSKCPYCGGTDTAGKGVRKTKTMGIRRLKFCKSCRRKFTPLNQPTVQLENSESADPQAPTSTGPEIAVSPGPSGSESLATGEPAAVNNEHHSGGL